MKAILRLLGLVVLIVVGAYLLSPSPKVPVPPPGSLISIEPADTESVYRQAYYTNLSRSEIMHYYKQQWNSKFQFDLNHPPEDAATLIRDQTRSNYLEELVHPWKEVLYVNGYTPTKPEDMIVREGKIYAAKITVHYIPSAPVTRLTVLALATLVSYLLIREYRHV